MMGVENQERKSENIAHIILIGNIESKEFDNITSFIQEMSLDMNFKVVINEKFRENFPEIYGFLSLFENEKQKYIEPDDIKLYLCYEDEQFPYKELIKMFLQSKGFECSEYIINFDNKSKPEINRANLQRFGDEILKIRNSHDEIFFNITSGNLVTKEYIISFASEVDGRIYILANSGDLIFLPECISHEVIQENFNYDEVMIDSLNFNELTESGIINYDIKPEIIPYTFNSQIKIQNDTIIIRKSSDHPIFYDLIKLIKIYGIKLSKDEQFSPFLNKVLEGLSHLKNNIIRLILNEQNGIQVYLGVILSGTSLRELKISIGENMDSLKKLLKATYPGLESETVMDSDLRIITEFIRKFQHFGCIVGYRTEKISTSILKELENALWADNWGMMVIGKSMTDITINHLINELESEINSIRDNLPIDIEELKGLIETKKWSDYADVSKLKVNYFTKIYKIKQYLEKHRNIGLWNTCNYIFADIKSTYNTIYSIIKSNYKTFDHFWHPIKVVPLDNLLKQFPKNFQLVSVQRHSPIISNNLELFQTIYSSFRLAEFIFLPSQTLNNFEISNVPPFQTQFPKRILESLKNPIKIGTIKHSIQKDNNFFMDYDAFMKHCLIMGSTGSGKTNTIMNILIRIREEEKDFPFLIIDPVKKEYRHLREVFNDLEIFTTGREVNPLKINMFEVPPFLTYSQWVNELLELFCNAFYIWSPLRERIWSSLNEIYTINGWTEEVRGRNPTLEEFLTYTSLAIDCSSYDARNKAGLKGAYEQRIGTLNKGTRALTFNCYASRPNFEDVMKKPVVMELSGLMNENEKAFVLNLFIKKLHLYRQHIGFSNSLKHITVIEEAHRLLGAEFARGQKSDDSIKSKVQQEFSDLLSEIRAYGEGIILSEQKPKKLIDTAITNTNLKICHKLPSLDQIRSFADSLNLSNEHLPFVTRLKPGECVIKIDEVDYPFFIQVDLAKDDKWGVEKEFTDEDLHKYSSKEHLLDQLHYAVGHDSETNNFTLKVTELKYQDEDEEIKVENPTRQRCLEFSNFEHLLWRRLQEFYYFYDFCPKCMKVSAVPRNLEIFQRNNIAKLKDYYQEVFFKDRYCPKCRTALIKIDELYLTQFNIKVVKNEILRKAKLNFLYKWHKILAPSEFDSKSQIMLNDIKIEFRKIVDEV